MCSFLDIVCNLESAEPINYHWWFPVMFPYNLCLLKISPFLCLPDDLQHVLHYLTCSSVCVLIIMPKQKLHSLHYFHPSIWKQKKILFPFQSHWVSHVSSRLMPLDVLRFIIIPFLFSFSASHFASPPSHPPTHPPSLHSVNWVFDLNAREHLEMILAMTTCSEKKIKQQSRDKKKSK